MAPLSRPRDREISSRGCHQCFILSSSVVEVGQEKSSDSSTSNGFWEPRETAANRGFSFIEYCSYFLPFCVILTPVWVFWSAKGKWEFQSNRNDFPKVTFTL
jgi:hypothetical protein